MQKASLVMMAMVSLVASSACSNKKPPQLPPAPATTDGADGTGSNWDQSSSAVPGSQADFASKSGSDTVHFETDRFDLTAAETSILDAQARWLASYPQIRITIEGHCDERGTREYNVALGERRANTVKNYLATRGVAISRMSTISYGKEHPLALGSDESAWAQNRRAVTVLLTGPTQ
jgi:peptidoglycan-associated lipoprotein